MALVQPRWKLGLVALLGLGCLAICIVGVVYPPEDTDLRFGVYLGLPLSVAIVVFGAVGIFRPGRLNIDEQGVVYRTAFHTRRWAWSDLAGVEIVKLGRTPAIVFRRKTAPPASGNPLGQLALLGNDALPGAWPIKTRELFDLITEAKARWG
ncbi:MAG TPA: PH domain-containing protein [Phenylobacterium sp.]